MRKLILILIITLGLTGYAKIIAQTHNFKVLQLSLWNGATTVPGGYEGFLKLLEQTDPDVVFLCEIKDGPHFMKRVIDAMKRHGQTYYGETFGLAVGILTKFPPDSLRQCCTVIGNEERTMVKLVTTIGHRQVAFYSCHLDHRHYACYLPRGYDGATWRKMDRPVTDEAEILAANRLSFRDESVRAFLAEARHDLNRGCAVILGGDFNEPSHLDWQDDTRTRWDHNGAVINWECSCMLQSAGFKDAYRTIHPNPVSCPGFTFPAGNRKAEETQPGKLAWAPEADERDRIDFIYFHPANQPLQLTDCILVGPQETVFRGTIAPTPTADFVLTPAGIWPSDHRGQLATFIWK